MKLRPAMANTGIVFHRMDIDDGKGAHALVEARFDAVESTMLGTTVANDHGVSVSTIEHLMAAFAGCGVDNAIVEINASEVPIMDGSSAPFVFLIECAGISELQVPRRVLKILKSVVLEEGAKRAELSPGHGFTMDLEIDFDNPVIGTQSCHFEQVEGAFKNDLGRARTFCFMKDIELMHANGLALGGSLDNAIVIDGEEVLNEEGLRYADEFVRHKALDAIGDLFLTGGRIEGHFKGSRTGHDFNNRLLRKLLATEGAYEFVPELINADRIIPAEDEQRLAFG